MAETITYNNLQDFQYVYTASSGGTVFSANLKDETAFDLFLDTAEVGDCIYFGFKNPRLWFRGINFYIGTAMACTSKTLVWEYSVSPTLWTDLPNVVDDTNGFTTVGENEIGWDIITQKPQWQTINGQSMDWIRVRISAIDTPSEGGAQSTQKLQARDGAITISNPGSITEGFCQKCYDEDVAQGWGVVEKIGTRMYYFNCHIFLGFSTDADYTTITETHSFIEITGLIWAIKSYSVVRLGKELNASDRTSINGCAIYGSRVLSSYFSGSNGIKAEIYNSLVKFGFYTMGIGYNSIFETGFFIGKPANLNGPVLSNILSSKKLAVGSYSLYEDAQVIRPVIYNMATDKAIRITFQIFVRNPIILDAQYLGYCENSAREYDSVIIDPETDVYNWYWGATLVGRGPKASICYSFNLKILDKDGNPIENAKVELTDKNGNDALFVETGRTNSTMTKGELNDFRPSVDEYAIGDYAKLGCEIIKVVSGNYPIFTVDRGQLNTDDIYQYTRQLFKLNPYLETDVNGAIDESTIETNNYKNESGDRPGITAETAFNPFTLTIRKAGYKTYKTTFTLDKKIDWKITLSKVLDFNTSKRVSMSNQ